jgi:hypothetical protein
MGQLVGALFTSHGGFTTVPSEHWAERRAQRSYRPDVPEETQDEMDAKWARTQAGLAGLKEKLAELRPDVLVIFGDDQEECFDFNNHPSLAVYVGAEFSGKAPGSVPFNQRGKAKPALTSAPGHPGLATHLLTGLLERDFDPAFMIDLPKPEVGMCHAIMNPLGFFTEFEIPTVPVLINAYYAPQISAHRCHGIGQAVRDLIESYPEDLRVVAIGSGGLWHTPGQPNSWLNEEFDETGLGYLAEGEVKSWADYFDGFVVGADDTSQEIGVARHGVSGLPSPGGPQFGTRETLCWIAAASVVEGHTSVILDYVPIYASPVGNGFAYCTDL